MTSSDKSDFDECPACGAVMAEVWADCQDGDPECGCDNAWDCPGCGRKWMDPCPAHRWIYERDPEPDRELVPNDRS